MVRFLLIGLVVLIGLMGCTKSVIPEGVILWLEVPPTVSIGEAVPLALKIKNTSNHVILLGHASPPYNFVVTKPDGSEIWRWTTGILDLILTTPLNPGEEIEFTAEWDQRELKWDDLSGPIRGDPVPPGTYWVQGIFHGNIFERVYKGGAEHLKTKPKQLIIQASLCSKCTSTGIEITSVSIVRQLCDLNLNSSYEIAVTWRVYGGTPPLTVWISYETLEGQTQTFGPFPWPEQDNFTLLIDSYEGETLLVQALAQDQEGARKRSTRHVNLRPCTSLPPMKPIITIVPSGGTATQEHITIEATMTNTLAAPIWAQALVATGCTVERTQPELPLLLEPNASKIVYVSLRCPEGGARWRLRVVEKYVD